MKFNLTKLGLGLALGLAALTAQAQEVTLKAASAFSKDSFFDRKFERFVKDVNENGKGIVQINFVGGPESMPPFEVGNAVRAGVIDMANTTGVFFANMVPEALALSFTPLSMKELRDNGGFELMDKILREKGNMVWLGRTTEGLKYHIWTTKKPTDGSFSGMKLRSVPIYRAFFQSLGANPLQVPPGEVYTALERGVVDGYGWPSVGIFDLGWQEKTKYLIDPGFYNVEVSLFVNQNTWNKLNDEQRNFLQERVRLLEDAAMAEDAALAEKELKQVIDGGIELIELTPEQAADFTAKATESAWQAIDQGSPKYGAELRKLLGGQN
ncbi:TRAP transporter substrate-binding protein DctP [Pusillimonas sp. CC-YST705]|uniref:TRAP transporter substrate-binding protein DctP n=1 Tax=Mesopusillimonas faecipullorum TaxID=2755040 RepID=A0ABS8CDI9_9BURK|nr:TRAP transporter substrate-binding protein DctP [Mesopusillimonas faecipullorum]MCB5364105.1 TRAP transporter substrate-binding protein DctP [Mesopusillimonas faecipullorum]